MGVQLNDYNLRKASHTYLHNTCSHLVYKISCCLQPRNIYDNFFNKFKSSIFNIISFDKYFKGMYMQVLNMSPVYIDAGVFTYSVYITKCQRYNDRYLIYSVLISHYHYFSSLTCSQSLLYSISPVHFMVVDTCTMTTPHFQRYLCA